MLAIRGWCAPARCGVQTLVCDHARVTIRGGALTPAQQLKIMALVWDKGPGYDGWVFLPWIPSSAGTKAERRANWNEGPAFKWPADRDRILQWLEVHTKDDLYFTPNTFLGEARVAQLTGEERALYADLDEVDPRSDIDPQLKPTIAWETSPGRFQAIWLLNEDADGSSEAGGLNHRLTAMLGADPSGWDTTQLLRVPGRRNFKPDYRDDEGDSPPGKLLWVTNKRYRPDFFDNLLPDVTVYGNGSDIDDADIAAVDRYAVWGRVRLKVSHNVREYMSMKARQIDPDEHDRSAIMWQIERDLADAGCSVAEIVAIVRHTPWNKHDGRNNEMAQLKAEAAKAIGVVLSDADEETLESESIADSMRPQDPLWYSAVASQGIRRPDWLVRNIWTKGSCGFISGAPKSYKSYIGLDMAISVATGTPFLNDPQFSTRASRVLYLQEEDSLPLVLMRAEQVLEYKSPDRHHHGQLVVDVSSPSTPPAGASGTISDVVWMPPTPLDTLALHVRSGFVASSPAWQAWLLDFVDEHRFDLVVIDTLGTTVGDIDTDKSGPLNDKVLKPLRAIAETTGVAIAIVHHNKKTTDVNGRSGQQMLGSVALHAWVESALYVQSKEKNSNEPWSEIKVERENKLAEDMKFRVRVPTMYQERGDQAGGNRQMWEPQVMHGWSETIDGEQAAAKNSGMSKKGGLVMQGFVEDMGEGWHTFKRICQVAERNPGTARGQLNKAVANGLLQHDQDNDSYRVMG